MKHLTLRPGLYLHFLRPSYCFLRGSKSEVTADQGGGGGDDGGGGGRGVVGRPGVEEV